MSELNSEQSKDVDTSFIIGEVATDEIAQRVLSLMCTGTLLNHEETSAD